MARVEQGHLPVMMNVGLVAFVTDDAIDFVSDCPELGFLWCFIFHASTISQNCKKARDFFIFIFGHSAKLAWYLNDRLCKLFIYKHLGRAAGRAGVSR